MKKEIKTKINNDKKESEIPLKYILTNSAECDHMKNTDNFKINENLIENFFSSEKANELQRKENLEYKKERDELNKVIKNVLPHMKREEEIPSEINSRRKHSLNNGSLYNMFMSEFFGMNMVLIYLDSREEKTIIDTLINLIYKSYVHQSLFYIPQLCVMLNYKKYKKSLESYLLDRCINQIKFSLQIFWLLNSYTEDDSLDIKKDIYEDMLRKIEETLVNGNRRSLTQYLQYEEMSKKNLDSNRSSKSDGHYTEIIEKSIKKEMSLEYFNLCIDFYNKLKEMCEDLRNFEKGEPRKNALKEYIENFNQILIQQRITFNENLNQNNSFYGIILPFNDSDSTNDKENTLMVNFIIEQSFCFSTKARVPTKLCAECVKVEECQNWDELIIQNEKNIQSEKKINFTLEGRKSDIENTIEIKKIRTSISHNLEQDKEKEKEIIEKRKKKEEELKKFYNNINTIKKKEEKKEELINEFEISPNITDEIKNIFGKPVSKITEELKEKSQFKNFKTYSIRNFIAKANDDLRQELLAMQMIKLFNEIFKKAQIPLKIHAYEILITSSSSGLLEFLSNTSSIDGIKKAMATESKNLNLFYRKYFNDFEEAQKNFVESLAAYSLICYYLQIKDRHNGNILIDMYGNIIHIDFGFILGISPGNLNFESAPFKLTKEYIEIMDGENSEMFTYYKSLMIKGMIEAKKHVETFVKIVEIMSHGSKMPCFDKKDIDVVIQKLRERFYEKESDRNFPKIVDDLVYKSNDNFWTNKYDYFQKVTNGILP
jgi:phosphatidylinositol 4-kinase